MSTPEQIIAEHPTEVNCDGGVDCGCGLRFSTYAGWSRHVVAALTSARHAIVDQDKLDGLRQWRDRVALALGVADEVTGYGVHSAEVDQAVERAESLVNIENEHDECPVWCDECERWERPMSCTHCKGSGCGPGTALGAYAECEWCAGDGREHDPDPDRRRVSVVLPEVTRPEWYDAEVPIDGPGMNGARVVRDGDQVSFLGVPCPVRADLVPVFAAALLAVHQDTVATDGGDQP